MVQAAAVIRILALAFWVGGMAALDFLEAPLRFGSAVITRNQAVQLGQLIVTQWVRAEWVLGAIALVSALVSAAPRWSIWLIVLMLATVTLQGAYLAPAITQLARSLDFVNRTLDPRYASIRHLHAVYAVLELIVFIGGVAMLAAQAWAWPGKR